MNQSIKFLILTVCLGLAYSQSPPDCPSGGSETVYFPDWTDCSKYWMCSTGWPYHMTCAPPLHWNQEAKTCTMPNDANCSVTAGPTQAPTTQPPPK